MKGFNLSSGSASGAAVGAGVTAANVSLSITNGGSGGGGIAPVAGATSPPVPTISPAPGMMFSHHRTFSTAAEVNADAHPQSLQQGNNRRSPITKLARLARLAGSAKDGLMEISGFGHCAVDDGSATSTVTGVDSLCAHHSATEAAVGTGGGPFLRFAGESHVDCPEAMRDRKEHLRHRRDGANGEDDNGNVDDNGRERQDKFSKNRSPIQCLNPMQLQAPASVSKAQGRGTAATDLESGHGSRVIEEGPTESSVISSGGRLQQPHSTSNRALQRTFRVDLNDDKAAENTPLLQGSSGGGGGWQIPPPLVHSSTVAKDSNAVGTLGWRVPGGEGDSANTLVLGSSNSSSEDRGGVGVGVGIDDGVDGGVGVGGVGAIDGSGATTKNSSAAPVSTSLPGLRPAKNTSSSSSGWL